MKAAITAVLAGGVLAAAGAGAIGQDEPTAGAFAQLPFQGNRQPTAAS